MKLEKDEFIMTEIKRTMIASLLIEQAGEMKQKRPIELGFEELVDVVESVIKNCSIPDVVGSEAEQLPIARCGCEEPDFTEIKVCVQCDGYVE